MGIVKELWSMQRGYMVVLLQQLSPFDTPVSQLPQSPENSLIDLAEDCLTDRH